MIEFEVTTTPVDLCGALGANPGAVWQGRILNRGPATVYRVVQTAAAPPPDPAVVQGWRHAEGDEFAVFVDDASAVHWVWTAGGAATLVLEGGPYL